MYAVIFDTIEPYVYEAFPIMFLPSGSIYEARFQLHHLSDQIVDRIQEKSFRKEMENSDILLCIRSKYDQKNEHSDKLHIHCGDENELLITPLRYAKLHSIHVISGVVLIRYRLAQPYNYFDEPGVYDEFDTLISVRNTFCQKLYKNFHGNKRNSQFSDGELPHVFEIKSELNKVEFTDHYTVDNEELNDDVDPFSKNWRGAVALCSCLPYLSNIPFIKFCGFRRLRRLRADKNENESWFEKGLDLLEGISIKISERFGKTNYFRNQVLLKSGATYELKIFEVFPYQLISQKFRDQVCRPDKSDFTVSRDYQLQLDGNFFTETRQQRAIGGYDFLEFSVPVKPGTHGYVGSMHLNFDDYVKDERNFISTQMSIEYRIAMGLRLFYLFFGSALLIFLAIGTELNWGSSMVQWLAPNTGTWQKWATVLVWLLTQIVYLAGVVGVVSWFVTKIR